jgi:hypothetical protein
VIMIADESVGFVQGALFRSGNHCALRLRSSILEITNNRFAHSAVLLYKSLRILAKETKVFPANSSSLPRCRLAPDTRGYPKV